VNKRNKAYKLELDYQKKLDKYLLHFQRRVRNVLQEVSANLAQAVSLFENEPFYTDGLHTPQGQIYLRNKSLRNFVDGILKEMRQDIRVKIADGMAGTWDLSNRMNNGIVKITTFGLTVPASMMYSMTQLNLTALRNFIQRTEEGMSLSKRLWNLSNTYKYELENYIASGITTGKDAVALSRDLTKFLKGGVSTVYENGVVTRAIGKDVSYQALRLARTEVNMAYHMSNYNRRNQLDFVTGVEVYLSGSHMVEDICDSMAGDYPKGFVFLGWHPNCICGSRSILLNEKEFVHYIETENINPQRYVRTIPKPALNYIAERKENFLNYTNKPYFLRDNFDADLNPLEKVFKV
jgi:hypothetical protein